MRIPFIATNNAELVNYFLKILNLFHNLKGQELKLMEILLTDYLNYQSKLNNKKQSFELIFSTKAKARYREELGIKQQRLVNLLYSLRKKKVLVGETIQPKLIPASTKGIVHLHFDINLKY